MPSRSSSSSDRVANKKHTQPDLSKPLPFVFTFLHVTHNEEAQPVTASDVLVESIFEMNATHVFGLTISSADVSDVSIVNLQHRLREEKRVSSLYLVGLGNSLNLYV